MRSYVSETDAVVSDICDHMEGFNLDELRVLLFVAQRLAKGRRQYGPLNPADPTKDWMQEFDEELVDALVYRAAQRLRESASLPEREPFEKFEELAKSMPGALKGGITGGAKGIVAPTAASPAKPCPECNGAGWIFTGRRDESTGEYVSWRCECQRETGGEGG
jgi:hypothetical protein